MEIIFNTAKNFANLTIIMTQEEIEKNNVRYNGQKIEDFASISSNSFNFNIEIINRRK